MERAGADHAIFDPCQPKARILGKVVSCGLSDELNDRHYLIVDGIDGRTTMRKWANWADPGDYEPGAIVAVEGKAAEPRRADRTIAEIANQSGGLYSETLHRAADRRASAEYVRAHVRRLEAMRRSGFAERFADGSWAIPEDFLDKARAWSLCRPSAWTRWARGKGRPGSTASLWRSNPSRCAREFGREAEDAMERRRRWFMQQGLAKERDGRTVYQRNLLRELHCREVSAAVDRLSKEFGKPFAAPLDGERI